MSCAFREVMIACSGLSRAPSFPSFIFLDGKTISAICPESLFKERLFWLESLSLPHFGRRRLRCNVKLSAVDPCDARPILTISDRSEGSIRFRL